MELLQQGFTQSRNDYSMFIKNATTSLLIPAVYVDDIIITDDDIPSITRLKHHLHTTYSIKDLGSLSFSLALKLLIFLMLLP